MIPICYDLQLQLPTASVKNPIIPKFFGSIKIDFQLTKTLFAENKFSSNNLYWNTTNKTEFDYIKTQTSDNIRLKFMALNLDSFKNVSLQVTGSNRLISITKIQFEEENVIFIIPKKTLSQNRYVLNIKQYQGLITYEKGIYYRDAGGFPVLGTDLFLNYSHSLFPSLGGPLSKTTIKLVIVHPKNTVALFSMHARETSRQLSENWRVTQFFQAPNLVAYMFALAVLPKNAYEKISVNLNESLLQLNIWTNKLIHPLNLNLEIAKLAQRVYSELFLYLNEHLPLAHLNIIVMNDFNGTSSFGIITISYEEWELSDNAHKIALLAKNFAKQWFGGVTTISKIEQFCIQEDIVEYFTSKVVKNLLKFSKKEKEQYFLAKFVWLHVAETFLAPGESVLFVTDTNAFSSNLKLNTAIEYNIYTHCGLKGAQMLYSLETIGNLKNESFVTKLRNIIKRKRHKSFRLEDLLDILQGQIVDAIDLAQVYAFWLKNGGIPNLLIEKYSERLQLTQLNQNRQAQIDTGNWMSMPLWPLRISIRNLTLPMTFMINQALELFPIDSKTLALTNIDFKHLYRVNYDAESWEKIIQNFDTSLFVFSARTRAQLFNDFCYFNAVGQISEKKAFLLRKKFLQLIRDHYESFKLCELYVFWCAGGYSRKINMDKSATIGYFELIKSKLLPALKNNKNYECGGPGAVSDAANKLCQLVFGVDCL